MALMVAQGPLLDNVLASVDSFIFESLDQPEKKTVQADSDSISIDDFPKRPFDNMRAVYSSL